MSNLIHLFKKTIRHLTTKVELKRVLPSFVSESLKKPDAELRISVDILNEILNQNFPLESSVSVGRGQKVKISVAAAEIQMKPHHEVIVRITNAAIHYDRKIIKIGLHSNAVSICLHLGIVTKQNRFYLVGQGWFPEFDIDHLPKWVESRLAEVLRSKLLSPLLNLDINSLLTLKKEFETDIASFTLMLKPQDAVLAVNEKGISLQIQFQKQDDNHFTQR